MQKSLSASNDDCHGPGPRGNPRIAAINLLLVSRSTKWFQAVQHATEQMGGGDILSCDVRGALARWAGTAAHYSHLLVDRDDAEGLLDELADLAQEVAAPDTDMLVL